MVDIYVLECEGGNIYVGRTDNGIKRLKQHISGKGAKWTQKHKPNKILHYIENGEDSDEKKVTLKMMKKFGASKVRGGPYVKREMSKSEIAKLEKKVGFKPAPKKKRTTKKKTSSYRCGICGREGHNRTECYAKTTVDGKKVRKAKPVCSKCGRDSHTAQNCYAKTTASGKKIGKSKKRKDPSKSEVAKFTKLLKKRRK